MYQDVLTPAPHATEQYPDLHIPNRRFSRRFWCAVGGIAGLLGASSAWRWQELHEPVRASGASLEFCRSLVQDNMSVVGGDRGVEDQAIDMVRALRAQKQPEVTSAVGCTYTLRRAVGDTVLIAKLSNPILLGLTGQQALHGARTGLYLAFANGQCENPCQPQMIDLESGGLQVVEVSAAPGAHLATGRLANMPGEVVLDPQTQGLPTIHAIGRVVMLF